MRFGNRNRVAFTTTTTGTGPYVIGSFVSGNQSAAGIADGTVVNARVIYGSKCECGSYTKQGLTFVRTRIYEVINNGVGTLGNTPVDWGPGDKVFSITPLAENKVTSPDGSITINDNPVTGATELAGLKISDVEEWFGDRLGAGVDIQIDGSIEDGFTIHNLRTSGVDDYQSLITLDVSRTTGKSTHVVNIEGNPVLEVSGHSVGQVFEVKLDYDQTGGRSVLWWSGIKWLGKGVVPHLTPVGGGQDTFRFQVVELVDSEDEPYPYQFIGEIVSTERPVILDLETTPNVYATVETLQQGSAGGVNEIQYLAATIDSDYMEYRIERSGTVTGGTFDIVIQVGSGTSYAATNIPYNATATEILTAIWTQTPFKRTQIQVGSGTNGADCTARLTDVAGVVRLQFLGADRYFGYVISVASGSLIGGGSYQAFADAAGSGSTSWPFTLNNLTDGQDPPTWATGFKLTFNGQTTDWCDWAAGATGVASGQSILPGIQQRLEALSNIGVGNIRVRQWTYGVYTFEFIGALKNTNINGEIQFAPGFLPQTLAADATGQIYGTTQNGAGPTSYNEIQRLTITGNPTQGHVILTIRGNVINVPVNCTLTQFEALIAGLPGFTTLYSGSPPQLPSKNYSLSGGSLPTTPITIEFINDLGFQNIPDSTVDVYSAGAAEIDWSICNGVRAYISGGYGGGNGTYRLLHKNPTSGETIHVSFLNEGSDFAGTAVKVQDGWTAAPDAIPPRVAQNEVHRITFTGNPTSGNAIVQILGKRITIPYNATASQVKSLLETITVNILGIPTPIIVNVTGGPLPATPVVIEYSGPVARQNIADPIWIYPASGTVEWVSDPIVIEWNGADLPTIPPNHGKMHIEFYAENPKLIIGKNWFHTGEDDGGSESGPANYPGWDIEIEQDTLNNRDIIHHLETSTPLVDAPTILVDLDPSIGRDRTVTIAATRHLDVVNEEVGKKFRLFCYKGVTALHKLIPDFEVEWASGYQPDQTSNAGVCDVWEFLCLRKRTVYEIPKFKGWVLSPHRPQQLNQTAEPLGGDEVQQIYCSIAPSSGTWIVSFQGVNSSPIPHDANAASLRAYLQAMPSIGTGNITVAGGPLGVSPFLLTFVNDLGSQNLPQITLQTGNLQF